MFINYTNRDFREYIFGNSLIKYILLKSNLHLKQKNKDVTVEFIFGESRSVRLNVSDFSYPTCIQHCTESQVEPPQIKKKYLFENLSLSN